ncbi:MAG: DUF1203 domain-containing protein [Myxococcales bacterium]|nr:DUF1203 domain-containing protein [Myxococcales bacterium]
MQLLVQGIPTDHADHLRRGGLDANHQPPVRTVAEGGRNPCRHCLGLIAPGEPMLVLAYRPFAAAQPYAEIGPVFVHADACPRYRDAALPAWFAHLTPALIRGYDARDWIVYPTGAVVAGPELADRARTILGDPAVAYVHVRSQFNCYQARIERG